MGKDNLDFPNITALLQQTAEAVEKKKKEPEEEQSQLNDIFTDFNFDDSSSTEDDALLEDVIPFEEAVLLQQKKQEVPRWIIITGITLATSIILLITFMFGVSPLMYAYYLKKAQESLEQNNSQKTSEILNKSLFYYKGAPDEVYVNFAKECWNRNRLLEAEQYLNLIQNRNFLPMFNIYSKVFIKKFDLKSPMDTTDYLEKAMGYCDLMDKSGVSAESLYNRAEIYFRRNELDRAVDYFERARSYNPQDPAPYIKLRRLYLKLNDFEKALKIQISLDQLESAPPRDAEALAALGQIFIAKGDYKKAEEFYKASIKKNPEQPEMYLQLARIYKRENSLANVDLVMENYEEYLKRKPNDPYVLTELGYMKYKKGNIKEAALKLQQSLALNPTLPLTHYYIAKIYTYIFNNHNYAIKEYERAIDLYQKQASLNTLADTQSLIGQSDEMDLFEVKFHYAYSLYNNNNFEESLNLFSVLENNPDKLSFVDTVTLSYNIANSYLMNENYNNSIEYYNRLLKSTKINENQRINLLNNIGMAYNMMNISDSAATYFWQACELQEDYLDKAKQDFIKNTSKKPKLNFKRLFSNASRILNLKDYVEWEILTPEKFKSSIQ